MKLFFLFNPSNPKHDWDYRQMAAQAAKRYGWTPRFGEVNRRYPHSTEQLLAQALEEGCTRIAVLGGDGTLNRVINALRARQRLASMELAVVPGGTCNDFARLFRLVKNRLLPAFDLAAGGKARLADLGTMDGRLFLNNAGIGRRPTPPGRRPKPFETLRNFRPIALRALWDKGTIEGRFYMALVCNAPFFSGGLHFAKTARITDGLLDVYLVPVMPKWRLLGRLAVGKLGRPVVSRQMIALRVAMLKLEADSDLWPQEDGEPGQTPVRQLTFAVAAEKAMIVVPNSFTS